MSCRSPPQFGEATRRSGHEEDGGHGESKIVFLHMAHPENPTQLDCDIKRPNIAKAGAVAFAKLLNGKFVCGVWREVKKKPVGRLDFMYPKQLTFGTGSGKVKLEVKKLQRWRLGVTVI